MITVHAVHDRSKCELCKVTWAPDGTVSGARYAEVLVCASGCARAFAPLICLPCAMELAAAIVGWHVKRTQTPEEIRSALTLRDLERAARSPTKKRGRSTRRRRT